MRILLLLAAALLPVTDTKAAEVHEFPPGPTPAVRSFPVEEGNYLVTVELGGAGAAETTVRAEGRRLMVERAVTAPGEIVTARFVVNVRTERLAPRERNAPGGDAVALNPREIGGPTWDHELNLQFDAGAQVRRVTIERVDVPTVFLVGDSTVADQTKGDAASWGQMLPHFFGPTLAVANHAESGETLKSFLTSLRLAKVLECIKAGDWLFIQFGHNDQKAGWPQTYADASGTYPAYLRVFVAEARQRGAIPVLVTSPQRRTFDDAGKIRNTHGAYPQAVREVAAELQVPLIDLEAMSRAFYERLGPQRAATAFADGGRDPTHHNALGAYELARCVVQGIREANLPLAEHLRETRP